MSDIFSQKAIIRWGGLEDNRRTEMVTTSHALSTFAARNTTIEDVLGTNLVCIQRAIGKRTLQWQLGHPHAML